MMKAYKHLVKHAIHTGHTVSVYDGEDWAVKHSTKQTDIYAAIDSVGESQLIIRDKAGNKVAWVLVIDYDEEPENSVVDCSDNAWMEDWFTAYENLAC